MYNILRSVWCVASFSIIAVDSNLCMIFSDYICSNKYSRNCIIWFKSSSLISLSSYEIYSLTRYDVYNQYLSFKLSYFPHWWPIVFCEFLLIYFFECHIFHSISVDINRCYFLMIILHGNNWYGFLSIILCFIVWKLAYLYIRLLCCQNGCLKRLIS